jgi:hypothetical protein
MRAFSGEVRAPSNTSIGQPEAAAPSSLRESTGCGGLQKRARPNSRKMVLFDLSLALADCGRRDLLRFYNHNASQNRV